MSARWCCRVLHEEFGPMDLEELRELAESGTLGPGDLVRRETDDVWKPASKCAELQTIFPAAESAAEMPVKHPRRSQPSVNAQPSPRSEPAIKNPRRTTSEAAAEALIADAETEDEPEEIVSSPRERLIAWPLMLGLMTALFVANRIITSATPTFPQPRRVREQLDGLHWFLGTGPWSGWECGLLWIDSAVILLFVAGWLARRILR